MAKLFWVDAREFKKEIVTSAIEAGADAVFAPVGKTALVKELGIIKTIASDGDLKPGEDVIEITIKSKEDEEKAAKAPPNAWVVIKCDDWKVIPLENLIAKRPSGRLIAVVSSAEEAKVAVETMEKGADGVLLVTSNPSVVKKVGEIIHKQTEKVNLEIARIKSIKPLGMGDRVCVDTTTIMNPGQGMLVGNSSSGMLLVYAENVETPYCDPRPFRVNAGAVHAYIKAPDGKTKYLSDLKTGDTVLIVNHKGEGETAFVGRSKIERRPLMLVEAESEGREASLVMQNAETIRLTKPDGSPVSITSLKPGDEVLAFFEKAGRHFGMKVEETIREK